MDKEALLSVAPLVCATVIGCAGIVALCVRPDQASAIKDAVTPLLLLCGTAWQANRSQKQPGA